MTSEDLALYAETFDRIQPVRIEMYRTYHRIAMDFVPFGTDEEFRMLDLGCGTGTFLAMVLNRWPKASAVAVDFSGAMIEQARAKVGAAGDRVEFREVDLDGGLPDGLRNFGLVSSFSAIHHLEDENKRRLFGQICDALEPGGWFFFIDAMLETFDDDVYRIGHEREESLRVDRYRMAGFSDDELHRHAEAKERMAGNATGMDRISGMAEQVGWMREAGFRSVDHVWHFWMEHFFIARR